MKALRRKSLIKNDTPHHRLHNLYYIVWLGLGLAVLAVVTGAYWFYQYNATRPSDPPGVQSVDHPERLPHYKLVDQDGQAFTQSNMLKKWTIMFFGYNHCPDFCPTTLAGVNGAYNRLERQASQIAATTQVVFISVDPFRDTPSILADFVSHFNKGFIGVTGTSAQLHVITDSLDASYDYSDTVSHTLFSVAQRPKQSDYIVDHISGLYSF